MILPLVNDINPTEYVKTAEKLPIYMDDSMTFKQLKEKLLKIFSQKYNINDIGQIRLWKPSGYSTGPKEIAEFLRDKNIGGPQTEYKLDDIAEPEIEVNTGHDFPGMQFDLLLDKSQKDLEKDNSHFSYEYDLLVAEFSNADNRFIFTYNKAPGTFGKCESCYQIKILKVVCECKEASYCS